MTEQARPAYINYPGNVIMQSPLVLSSASLYGFFVKGTITALQNTVDQCLNTVSNNNPRYQVLSPYVLTSYTRVAKAYSAQAVDRDKGWLPEVDIVTWITVGEFELVDGQTRLKDIFVFPHHIFVDNSIAMANGRELYGYPKVLCRYDIPEDPEKADYFSCSVNAFKTFSADSEMAWCPLMEVQKVSDGDDSVIQKLAEGVSEFADLVSHIPDFWHLAVEFIDDVFDILRSRSLPQIFLKQFPDSAGEKAVYQAIVSAQATVDTIRSIRFSGNKYSMDVHPVASFPLAETLGVANGRQDVILPFHVDFDFTVGTGKELINNSVIAPKKVAILGGGVAAMTSAFYLTNQPGWQNQYDITVYQLGWRLGGKGASGRNIDIANRIQEHGLHIWFGFYDNAFSTMRQALAELERPEGDPMRSLDDIFHPHSYIVLEENVEDSWQSWQLNFPTNNLPLGDVHDELNAWDLFRTGYIWLKSLLGELKSHSVAARPCHEQDSNGQGWLAAFANRVKCESHELVHDVRDSIEGLHAFIQKLPAMWEQLESTDHKVLSMTLTNLRHWLKEEFNDVLNDNTEIRRLFIMADLGLTVLIGMVKDKVFSQGFDAINHYDFKQWLTVHGANVEYSVNSAPVRGFYDLVFAYEDGDISKPNVEAGTLLRCMMQIALNYKGAIMWKMQAGMGDAIFTPYYQALKQRGVKFEFFNQVDNIGAQNGKITDITITEQVSLKVGEDQYNPLISVPVAGTDGSIDCWPDRPNYSQIEQQQSELLQQHGVNLESFWSDWPELYKQNTGKSLKQKTLRVGQDFDQVICGVSIASLPHIAPSLLQQSPELKTMTEKVKTVATQAYQVWSNTTVEGLGWDNTKNQDEHPVLSGFVEPFDTWAVMDQVIDKETWPTSVEVNSIGYFCSVMPMAEYPPQSDKQYPSLCAEQVKQDALRNLKDQMWNLWPKVSQPGEFDWRVLVDLTNGTGEERFNSQYWRANIDPSERYVLSVTNSSITRLETDQTGFSNFYITGDWIKTPLNAGCVEAATMAGIQTANALSGSHYPIANSKGL